MKHVFLTLALLAINLDLFSQDNSPAKSKATMYDGSLYWYGFDFSMLRVYDYTLIGKEEYVKNSLCPSLTGYFKERVPDGRFISWLIWADEQGKISRKIMVDKSSLNFSSSQQLSTDSLIAIDGKRVLSSEKVSTHIKNQPLSETHGLGFIVLVESIGRKKYGINLIGIFFDIQSREVLHYETVKETPTKGSDVEAYGTGLFRGVRDMLNRCSSKF